MRSDPSAAGTARTAQSAPRMIPVAVLPTSNRAHQARATAPGHNDVSARFACKSEDLSGRLAFPRNRLESDRRRKVQCGRNALKRLRNRLRKQARRRDEYFGRHFESRCHVHQFNVGDAWEQTQSRPRTVEACNAEVSGYYRALREFLNSRRHRKDWDFAGAHDAEGSLTT